MKRTMTLTLTVLLVAAGATGPVAAQTTDSTSDADPGELVAAYNENVDQLPWFVQEYVAGERVELVVHDADGATSYYHGTVASDGRITDYEPGQADDPTVRVTTDVATLERIGSAENPAAAATAAYQSGDVAVDGVGVVEAVQVTVVETAVDAGMALGLL